MGVTVYEESSEKVKEGTFRNVRTHFESLSFSVTADT